MRRLIEECNEYIIGIIGIHRLRKSFRFNRNIADIGLIRRM